VSTIVGDRDSLLKALDTIKVNGLEFESLKEKVFAFAFFFIFFWRQIFQFKNRTCF